MVGKIRVGKYDWKRKKEPTTPGFVNVLIHTTGDLSPYEMKDDKGVIMETYWQMHKIWPSVIAQKQFLSRFDRKNIRWEHPAEIHIDSQGHITPAYWAWRDKGFKNSRWIRYPNGYKNHAGTIGSVIGDPQNYMIVDYIKARKQIYFMKYREIALKSPEFKRLKALLASGTDIQINEVDGPLKDHIYPYNLVQGGSLEMNPKVLIALINNPEQPFGHGYALAACLLDVDLTS